MDYPEKARENLMRELFQVNAGTFEQLSDPSPAARFYAGLKIAQASTDIGHGGLASVWRCMDASALGKAAESDPDWKVRKVASVAIRRFADQMGPRIGVDAQRIADEPLHVCKTAQAYSEGARVVAKALCSDLLQGIVRPIEEIMCKLQN